MANPNVRASWPAMSPPSSGVTGGDGDGEDTYRSSAGPVGPGSVIESEEDEDGYEEESFTQPSASQAEEESLETAEESAEAAKSEGVPDGDTAAGLPPDLDELATGPAVPVLLLLAASRIGDVEKARGALESKVDPNILDSWGLTPLHNAALGGHHEFVTLLLEHRASIDVPNDRGQTALHLAATENKNKVSDILLDHGADVTLLTDYGNSALELAMRHGSGSLCEAHIREAITNRWVNADNVVQEMRRELEKAEGFREAMEKQLGGPPVIDSPDAALHRGPGSSDSGSVRLGRDDRRLDEVADGGEGSPKSTKTEETLGQASLTQAMSGSMTPSASSPKRKKKKDQDKERKELPPYWPTAQTVITQFFEGCEAATKRAFIRPAPVGDTFPWRGPHSSTGSVLPENDPDDRDLLKGFERLQAAAESERRREERWAAKRKKQLAEPLNDDEIDVVKLAAEKELLEKSGTSQKEWEKLVAELLKSDATWDWSKIEVLERRREPDKGKTPGVFAAGGRKKGGGSSPGGAASPGGSSSGSGGVPVFRQWDIVGPLGGVLRRRVRYEILHCKGKTWVLHDPLAYEVKLRAKTTELAVEPLVVDLTVGMSQNRLRHLADARDDPMGLRALMEKPNPTRPSTAEALLRPRTSMPRPRSRPSSPKAGSSPDDGVPGELSASRYSASQASRQPSPTAAASRAGGSPASRAGGSPGPTSARDLLATASKSQSSRLPSPTVTSSKAEVLQVSPSAAGLGGDDFILEEDLYPRRFEDEEAEAAQESANVRFIEVLCDGWPYVFVVALRAIFPGEELKVDFGQDHWQASRFILGRLQEISKLGQNLLMGTKKDEEVKFAVEPPPVTFPRRVPMRRAEFQEDK